MSLRKKYLKNLLLPFLSLIVSACTGKSVPAMNTQSSDSVTTTVSDTVVSETVATTMQSISESTAAEKITSVTTAYETTGSSVPEPDIERFSAKLSQIYEEYDIIGMGVAIFSDGEVIYTENLGFADREREIPCDNNTRYRIASVSKLISTIGVMKMVDNGDISLDTELTDATGIKYDWLYSTEKVRLWHLLSHTAGIFDTWRFENEPNMKHDINRLIVNAHSGMTPGEVFCYSNFGSGSLGALIERITGEYFHDYMDRVVFTPLDMDAGYVIDLIDDKESAANLYDYDGEVLKPSEWGRDSDYYESFGLGNSYYSAQCELLITPSDLAQFGIALAGDGTAGGKTILSAESVAAMHKTYISTENFDMGLNVRIYDDLVEGRTIYGHPGNALGCINGIFYDPSDGTGFVFLTNHCYPQIMENGFYSAMYEALNEAYKCFFDRDA